MTLYNRPRAEVFAGNAPPSEIQPFQAWLRGLGIAFDETNGFPEFTGLNGLFNALNQYIKYLEQNGFAEWSADLEYPVGAGVRVGSIWYRARTRNTNKPPAISQNDWELFLNASALSYVDPLYIENNVVKIRDATTSQRGVARFATNTEAQTGAKVSAAITPDQAMLTSFGFGQTRKKDTLVLNTTYRNTSSKPWFVSMTAKNTSSGQPAFLQLKVNGNTVAVSQDVATPFNSNDVYVAYVTIEQIILPGESFIFENSGLGRFECSSEIS